MWIYVTRDDRKVYLNLAVVSSIELFDDDEIELSYGAPTGIMRRIRFKKEHYKIVDEKDIWRIDPPIESKVKLHVESPPKTSVSSASAQPSPKTTTARSGCPRTLLKPKKEQTV